jgi:hypothetical protein
VIPNDCPAIDSEPLREEVEVFAATEKDTVAEPLPEPLEPDVTVIHAEFETALQDPLQPDGVPVTVTDAAPPVGGKLFVAPETE